MYYCNNRVNRLSSLPRGLGSLPSLEILDLTYNNLNENSLPANFFLLKGRIIKLNSKPVFFYVTFKNFDTQFY